MSHLEVLNINKSFNNKCLLNNINFECRIGEIIGLFGKNGSGKSTLLKLIFGTIKADTILIKIDSKVIHPKEVIPLKLIAYMPQDSFLPKELKVRDVIPLFFPRGDDQDKIFYAPQVFSFEKIKVGKLSLGQLRYLELLIVGNLQHQFVMLDEPFSMIEPLYKDVIKDLLLNLKKTKGIILTDHYYDDVLHVTDRNFIICGGEMIDVKTKDDLYKYDYLKSVKRMI